MQTPSLRACQSCLKCHAALSLGPRWSANLVGVNESTTNRWYKKLGIAVEPKPKRVQRVYLRSIAHLRMCMNCHANIRMLQKQSAQSLGVQCSVVQNYRDRLGLWKPTATETNRALAIQSGKAKVENWHTAKAALRTRYIGPNSKPEQHMAVAWREEMLAAKRWERQCSWSQHPDAMRKPMDYYWANAEKARLSARIRKKQRYASDRKRPEFRAMKAIRNATSRIKRNVQRSYKSSDLLGVTVIEAKRYIEAQFEAGMTWQNHGIVWEIDHIIPLSAFDLTKPSEIFAASHYRNLRPIPRSLNRSKGSTFHKIDKDIYLASRARGARDLLHFGENKAFFAQL